jgi:hypothetical protein
LSSVDLHKVGWLLSLDSNHVNLKDSITHPFWELAECSKTDTVSEVPLLLSWLVSVGMTKLPPLSGCPEVYIYIIVSDIVNMLMYN